MTSQNTNRLATRCIHAGEKLDEKGAIHTPLYNHSTFGFTSTAAVLDVVEGRKQESLYTRYGLNPTIRSIVEHPVVLNTCGFLERSGYRVTYFITIMHANNEVGTIRPIEQIGELAKSRGILFHIDAAQSVGKIPVRVDALNADLLTVAGHKFYAPKGVGALFSDGAGCARPWRSRFTRRSPGPWVWPGLGFPRRCARWSGRRGSRTTPSIRSPAPRNIAWRSPMESPSTSTFWCTCRRSARHGRSAAPGSWTTAALSPT